jgi:hypothetical protein
VNAASLAGFALVFVVCAWTLSAVGGIALTLLRSRLARIGPLAERRVAIAVAVVPLVLALAIVAVLVAQSALGVDHCGGHGDHAHLCLVHGTLWIQLPWVVVVLAVTGATLAARAVLTCASFARGARSIRELRALSHAAGAVRIVDSERAFCFVAGRDRAEVYVSSRAWAALTVPERAALVAHELAHVRHGDLRMRAVLEGCLVFAAPLVGERVRATWLSASERLCDARAASATEPAFVASAMVTLCRLQVSRPATSFAFTPVADELAVRVEAVLANRPLGEGAAVMLGRSVVVACSALVVAAAVAADPLHHVFETLLG